MNNRINYLKTLSEEQLATVAELQELEELCPTPKTDPKVLKERRRILDQLLEHAKRLP
jgi:hypothetical protein